MKERVRRRNALGPLILAALVAASACGDGGDARAIDPVDGNGVEPTPVNVAVLRVAPTSLDETLSVAGRIEPWVAVEVASELGGTVEHVGFEKGEWVAKGRVLARIGTELHRAALAEAEAELMGAEANYKKTSELFERQAVPRQELVAATSRYEMAKARVEQARLRVERSILRAPIAGVAIDRHVEPGEVVAPGARVTTLHRLDRVKAVVGIPESDIAFFRAGSVATVEVDAYPGRRFEGTIAFLGPAATGQNRTFPAEIELANEDGALRPGMIARVTLLKRHHEAVVAVSRDVLVDHDDGTVAFVAVDGRARLRRVRLGPAEGNVVVVEDGLAPGEWLIVEGQRSLSDGQPVRIVERFDAPSPPAPGGEPGR